MSVSFLRSTPRLLISCIRHKSRRSGGDLASRGGGGSNTSSSPMRNPVSVIFGEEHAILDAKKGFIADNKPFPFKVEKYTEYTWCGCGLSHEQPFCDVTCKSRPWKKLYRESGGPLTYIAPESGNVWFCNCKQTNNAPFCDGSHRDSEIQEMRLDGKFELFEPKDK